MIQALTLEHPPSAAIARSNPRDPAVARHILDFLVECGELERLSADRAAQAQNETGERIDVVVVQLGLMSDAALLEALARYSRFPVAGADAYPSAPVLPDLLQIDYLRRNRLVPVAVTDTVITIVTADAFATDSLPSLSSLHAAEHFGLGRYGDPIDAGAHLSFMKSLQRVLAKGGTLYFSVPLSDRERVEFNAHRIFQPETILSAFDALSLTAFALIKDDGRIYEPAVPADVKGQNYACGLFEFTKPAGD